MSDQIEGSAPTPNGSAEGGNQEIVNNDPVSREAYRKTVGREKALKERVQEMQNTIANLEQQKLEAEGNKDAIIESLRKRNEELEASNKSKDVNYTYNVISNQIKQTALEKGFKKERLNKLMKFVEDDTIRSVEVDQNFNVNRQDLESIVDAVKKEIPEFFGSNVKPKDLTPGKPRNLGPKKPNEMSDEELDRLILS